LLFECRIGPCVAQGNDGTLGGDDPEDAAFEGSPNLGAMTQAPSQPDALACGRPSHAEALFGVVLEVLEAEPLPSLVLVELGRDR
jgi:hypothetical protein